MFGAPHNSAAKPRSIVYVDGFNLYYGAIRGTPHKWLDLERYFTLLRQNDDLRHIYYFTALVDGPGRRRQEMYLKALSTLPKVTVVLGKYKRKRVLCTIPGCAYPNSRLFETWEEKRTDVAIAVKILDDAHQNACDIQVLVSGDSDLVPPLHVVKLRHPHMSIVVYVPTRDPTRGKAYEIRSAADKHRNLPLHLLSKSQLPNHVTDGLGTTYTKPPSW